ncbi:efflux RND transporter periplasmic adaptor subunit [Spirochaetia bacterium 38H-sp]|uniref:Efflux RND transporter periplasmic adaptor subunit n=1 Tax=Rarispira pelagica TaxID=3141764 RepID=A0ABU9UDW2_9SPIR
MTRKKKTVLFIVLIVIIVVAIISFFMIARQKKATSSPNVPNIFKVISKVSSETVDISGNVEAMYDYDVVSYGSGIVTSVFVTDGDTVNKGELLLKLDDIEQKYNLENAILSLSEAEVSGSESEISLARLKVKIESSNLLHQSVYSPANGIITDFSVEEGAFISENEIIARVLDPSKLMAEVSVDEIDITQVREGQKVKFIFDVIPDVEVYGYVDYIAPYATVNSQGIAAVSVKIILDSVPDVIKPGFSFSGEIITSESEKILLIEKKAVSTKNDEFYVLLAPSDDSNRPELKKIRVEDYDDTYYKIISGLEEGDSVIMPISDKTKNGKSDDKENNGLFGPVQIPGMGPGPGPGPGQRPNNGQQGR